jgi:ParB family chromosome partitioning protein
MPKAAVPAVVVPYSKASATGLLLPKTLDETRWSEIGKFLAHVDGAVQWWIGDWWRYGEDRKWGELGQRAEEAGLNYQTCRNAGSIAGAFQLSRRRDNLSWSHHAEVAALEASEQDRFLNEAARAGWSVHALRTKVQGKPHVANNSGENEWYTPEQYVEAAREVMGEIDLDPASSAQANTIVQAQEIYTADDNGLDQDWAGRIWMNPPYASELIGPFAEKMAASFEAGDVTEAIVLVNNATETQWFQRLARSAKAICFPERRIRFWNAEAEVGAPLQGQAFLYLGENHARFAAKFAEFGLIVEVRGG